MTDFTEALERARKVVEMGGFAAKLRHDITPFTFAQDFLALWEEHQAALADNTRLRTLAENTLFAHVNNSGNEPSASVFGRAMDDLRQALSTPLSDNAVAELVEKTKVAQSELCSLLCFDEHVPYCSELSTALAPFTGEKP